jgi:hypothetical protein
MRADIEVEWRARVGEDVVDRKPPYDMAGSVHKEHVPVTDATGSGPRDRFVLA